MEIVAILLTFFVHLIGAGVLIWALIDHDDPDAGSWRDWWPKDRGDEPDSPVAPSGGLEAPILPDSTPSPHRLREPGRIADRRPGPSRRPEHVPAPKQPVREEV